MECYYGYFTKFVFPRKRLYTAFDVGKGTHYLVIKSLKSTSGTEWVSNQFWSVSYDLGSTHIEWLGYFLDGF